MPGPPLRPASAAASPPGAEAGERADEEEDDDDDQQGAHGRPVPGRLTAHTASLFDEVLDDRCTSSERITECHEVREVKGVPVLGEHLGEARDVVRRGARRGDESRETVRQVFWSTMQAEGVPHEPGEGGPGPRDPHGVAIDEPVLVAVAVCRRANRS